jgi:hypothetical protein
VAAPTAGRWVALPSEMSSCGTGPAGGRGWTNCQRGTVMAGNASDSGLGVAHLSEVSTYDNGRARAGNSFLSLSIRVVSGAT